MKINCSICPGIIKHSNKPSGIRWEGSMAQGTAVVKMLPGLKKVATMIGYMPHGAGGK